MILLEPTDHIHFLGRSDRRLFRLHIGPLPLSRCQFGSHVQVGGLLQAVRQPLGPDPLLDKTPEQGIRHGGAGVEEPWGVGFLEAVCNVLCCFGGGASLLDAGRPSLPDALYGVLEERLWPLEPAQGVCFRERCLWG